MRLFLSVILFSLLLTSCSYRPIFAPNAKFQTVGSEVANKDADLCMEAADGALKEAKKRRVVKQGARSAGMGALFGLTLGLFTGDRQQILESAAIGAGIGAIMGSGSVLAEGKLTPDEIKQRYTTMCLNQKGYSVLGWE